MTMRFLPSAKDGGAKSSLRRATSVIPPEHRRCDSRHCFEGSVFSNCLGFSVRDVWLVSVFGYCGR